MNIFITNLCPVLSAQALDNKRVVKMILESGQMLSSAIWLHTGETYHDIYKPAFVKHPCTIWAAESIGNWNWLMNHMVALADEYAYRYNGKKHSTMRIKEALMAHSKKVFNPNLTSITKFANCTHSIELKLDFRDEEDVVLAYQKYLNGKWVREKRLAQWHRREYPSWISPLVLERFAKEGGHG